MELLRSAFPTAGKDSRPAGSLAARVDERPGAPLNLSFTGPFEAQIPAEERQHVILESVGYRASMRSVVHLEPVLDAIRVQHLMQLTRINA